MAGRKNKIEEASKVIKSGGLIVAPTDTLYGILALKSNKKAIKALYRLKGRDSNKQLITLVSTKAQAESMAPGSFKVLEILPPKTTCIFGGGKGISLRLVRKGFIKKLVDKVGPVVAPSANPQAKTPALTVREAKNYFGDKISLYISGGSKKARKASTVILWRDKKVELVREGAVSLRTIIRRLKAVKLIE